MARTVHELRNEIRLAVGRYERVESTAFTKEALAAICESVGTDVGSGRFPPKAEMRADIRDAVGIESDDPGRTFRKAELEAIFNALEGD